MEENNHTPDLFDPKKASKDYQIEQDGRKVTILREDNFSRRSIQGMLEMKAGSKYRIKLKLCENNNPESDVDIGVGRLIEDPEAVLINKLPTFLLDCSDG